MLVYLIAASPASANSSIHALPAYVDATQEAPFSEIGTSRIVGHQIGDYREPGVKRFDRMAWLFEAEHVEDLVELTLEYPDDKDRMAEIFLFTEAFMDYPSVLNGAGAAENSLGTSYLTGYRHPISHRMVRDTFYFFVPRSRRFAIVLMTSRDGAPAAVKSLKLERMDLHSGIPNWPAETRLPDRRRFGIYWEDPVLVSNFGGPQPPSREEFALIQPVYAASPVYPQSSFITGIDFDMSTVKNKCPGNGKSAERSDNSMIGKPLV